MIPSPPLGTDAAAGLTGLGAPTGAGPHGSDAGRRFRFELAAHPGSPAQARRLTRARLTGWAVCEDTCDTAALVVSELVTNAIVHTASTRVVCELQDGADLVRIAVRDEGCAPGEPHPSPQRPEEEHGRGLLLVDALCRAWGAQEHGPGLVVWADLPRAAAAPGAPESCEPHEVGVPHGTAAPHEIRVPHGTDAPHEIRMPHETDVPHEIRVPRGTDAPHTMCVPHGSDAPHPMCAPHEVSDDLGWGARPKPAPHRNDDRRRQARHGAGHHTVPDAGPGDGPGGHRPGRDVPHQAPHQARTGTVWL
ncbi:ATP-binding protein [Streptomyces naganishii]|uniref:ATP-binding protein n=1 Tax=Streptomyces naganishii TaxID=285447 RepID=UPI0036C83DB7